MSRLREAYVTMAIGATYLNTYNKLFRASHERLARETGRRLIVFTDYIDKSAYGVGRHPAWQALLIFRSPQTEQFDRLCWIDADIYFTRNIRDPFEVVKPGEWGAASNNSYNLEFYSRSDLDLYKHCPGQNRPSYVLNMGFFVASRTPHREILERVYFKYPEQPCYYQGPLSYHLLNEFPGVQLDRSFNNLVPAHLIARGRSPKSLYCLVAESTGVHFCGGVHYGLVRLIAFIDMVRSIFQSKFWLPLPEKN